MMEVNYIVLALLVFAIAISGLDDHWSKEKKKDEQ